MKLSILILLTSIAFSECCGSIDSCILQWEYLGHVETWTCREWYEANYPGQFPAILERPACQETGYACGINGVSFIYCCRECLWMGIEENRLVLKDAKHLRGGLDDKSVSVADVAVEKKLI